MEQLLLERFSLRPTTQCDNLHLAAYRGVLLVFLCRSPTFDVIDVAPQLLVNFCSRLRQVIIVTAFLGGIHLNLLIRETTMRDHVNRVRRLLCLLALATHMPLPHDQLGGQPLLQSRGM